MTGSRRWLKALLVALTLHGLLAAGLTCLPNRQPCGAPAAPRPGDAFDPTDDSGGLLTVSFLVPSPPRKKALPPPAPLPPIMPSQLAPLPGPAQLDPLPLGPVVPVAFREDTTHPTGAASQGGSGAGKGKAVTSFFEVPAQGEKVVYVIDRSASMGMDRALDVARGQLLASLRQLPPGTWFQVIVYNTTAETLLPNQTGWLAATAENKWSAARALGELRPEGGTRHEHALPCALALQPDAIFFLTDADDLPAEHLRLVTHRNGGRAVIHVIELSTANRDRPGMPLQALARENRGTYQAVDLHRYR